MATATMNSVITAYDEQIPEALLEGKPTPKLSDWVSRAVEAFDANGQPNFLDAEGNLIAGIYLNMPNELYHSLPALSSSKLKDFAKGAPYYKKKYLSGEEKKPLTEQQKNTFLRGTLVHELVLEPEGFNDRYFREVSKDEHPDTLQTADDIKQALSDLGLKTTGVKADLIQRLVDADPNANVFEAIVERNRLQHGQPEEVEVEGESMTLYGGKRGVKADVWDDAHRAARTVRDEDQADLAIQNGLPEVTIIALCPETGLWLKVKFDWLRFDDEAVDLKTTLSTDPMKFRRQFMDLKYDIQQAFYTYVAGLAGIIIKRFLFVAVEFNDQDVCIPFVRSKRRIEDGERDCQRLLPEFKKCKDTNTWKSQYSGYVIELD